MKTGAWKHSHGGTKGIQSLGFQKEVNEREGSKGLQNNDLVRAGCENYSQNSEQSNGLKKWERQ